MNAKNVALRYTEKKMFEDVNLRIENGKLIVFVGPSGSGKTTMIKIIVSWNQLMEIFIWMASESKDYDERELVFLLKLFYRPLLCFPI